MTVNDIYPDITMMIFGEEANVLRFRSNITKCQVMLLERGIFICSWQLMCAFNPHQAIEMPGVRLGLKLWLRVTCNVSRIPQMSRPQRMVEMSPIRAKSGGQTTTFFIQRIH